MLEGMKIDMSENVPVGCDLEKILMMMHNE